MDKDTASNASSMVAPVKDAFRTVADGHKADVRAVRERNRQKRIRVLLYLQLFVFAWLLKRLIENNPLVFGLPTLGPDFILWAFPVVILLSVIMMVVLPMIINGRSPHVRFTPEEIGLNFRDVRGIDTVLEEVTRSLQIFLTYKTFREELGGNPRRGILFEGRPGTGKTHMAKAMAAEAGVPFFFVSAPAFHSMWYGMTAWKIRAFFKALRKAAAKEGGAIGFIEEMDAVGGARSGIEGFSADRSSRFSINRMASPGTGGMVNELLIQLQSFDSPPRGQRFANFFKMAINNYLPANRQLKKKPVPYSNILVIGATNRADTLDPALMRPGRFDRSLYFDLPSRAGRRELIDYFLIRRAHAEEMEREDLRDELAAMSLGYSPAMLEHILDEALVWAIREGRKQLSWKDIQRARLSEEIGLAQPVAYTARERDLIATHEAGHAVAAYLCAKERRLEVLSIIKRREALGLLAHSDAEERFTRSKSELEGTLRITLGGLAAELLFFGESGTGPASDLQTATQLAAQMIGSFGMGNSLVSLEAIQHGPYSSANIVAKVLANEDTRKEVEEFLQRHKDQVLFLLEKNRDLVEALRDALLEHEELLGDDIRAAIEETLQRRNVVAG
ncbi:MAG TPA: AAA family ATPase [Actinomycetota bacterium]|nr:AAA family ATPase [Actinomycetota bacterium]